jgi:hypothetical protein
MSETVPKEKNPAAFNLAVYSVVFGALGYLCPILPSVLGLIFGFMALHKIKTNRSSLKGRKLAIAGVIVSGATAAYWIILFPIICFFWGFAP